MQVHSYDNPTNLCAGCGEGPGCCDNFGGNDCTGEERCDNIFFYCLRPLGTPTRTLEAILENRLIFENSIEDHARELQCLQPPPAFRSDRNVDDGFINFSETEFLGLPNPMEFQVNASMWEVSGGSIGENGLGFRTPLNSGNFVLLIQITSGWASHFQALIISAPEC